MKSLLLLISAAPLAFAVPASAQSMQNMQGMNMPAAKAPAKKRPAAKPATPAKRKTSAKPATRPTAARRATPAAKPNAAAHDMSGMGTMPGMDMSATTEARHLRRPIPMPDMTCRACLA
ncbi:hypothetical protein [Sphingomonas bisphenolicum]|uniref:hypothetical protein n=1 Tax=Sphingomonas bisphenolicum TaxID=296544 RepID=UPI0029057A89|nr:hypothetical protein [Sphingomonas bisphenolicum]